MFSDEVEQRVVERVAGRDQRAKQAHVVRPYGLDDGCRNTGGVELIGEIDRASACVGIVITPAVDDRRRRGGVDVDAWRDRATRVRRLAVDVAVYLLPRLRFV